MTQPEISAWDRIGRDLPGGEAINAVYVDTDRTKRLLAGKDSEGRRHLLIKLDVDENGLADRSSRGLLVTTRELVVAKELAASYIDIACHEPIGYPALDMIATELIDQLETQSRGPAEIVKRLLAKWRRFWAKQQVDILSREEQLGLFAEIWFLHKWAVPQFGTESVQFWRGPWREPHDFAFPDQSIEVKATLAAGSPGHKISSLEQLEPLGEEPLYLFSAQLKESGVSKPSLPQLIADCYELFEEDYESLGVFETALLEVGYSPLHEDDYSNRHYDVVKESIYRVADDFPRLIASEAGLTIPAGVKKIRYAIDLQGFDHLIIASSPSEWKLEPLNR